MVLNKTRILYVVSTLRSSGPTNQLLGIIKNLDDSLFESRVLTLSPEPINTMIKDFRKEKIHISSLNQNRIQFNITGKSRLRKYIQQYNPDIIHTSGIRADTSVSKLNLKAKHCMTIRNNVYENYISKFGKIVGTLAANKSVKAMRRREYVVCCSKSLQNIYEPILSKKIYAIQNGVDVDKFKPSLNIDEKNNLRSSLGLPVNKLIFLMVGSLVTLKDPITTIEAFNKVRNKEKAVLLILGEGDLAEECKRRSNDSIVFKGNVNNVSDYLRAGDVFISSSKSEGLPNSVIEAGSTGLDLILSNIPQHREIIEENKDMAEFFNCEDVSKLSFKIAKNIEEYNIKINFMLNNYIESNFSNNIMSDKYQELYKNMLKEN